MGVADWFQCFCANLRVTNADVIGRRYAAITRRLNTDFWATTSESAHTWYVGSYGRNTAIAGFSDLDILAELPATLFRQYDGYVGNGQSALLQAVRNSIKVTYPNTLVGADGQVVHVSFDDGMRFEVVPSFKKTDGSFTFPDSNAGGTWRTTDPFSEIAALRTRNAACNNNLVPLCRMMRAWRRKWSVPVSGILIDTLANQFIATWEHRDMSYLYYDWLCRDFFKYMAEQSGEQTFWRAPGSGQYVYGNGLFQHKAKRCYNVSLEAIKYETDSMPYSAKGKWGEIFGSAYPD